MRLHLRHLDRVERTGLVQDRIRDADLADVVDHAAPIERVEHAVGKAEALPEETCGLANALRVPLGESILSLDCGGEGEDHVLSSVEGVVELLQTQG